MGQFSITFSNVLLALLYMLPGYLLCRRKMVNPDHLSSVSVILLYVCSPCMFLNALIPLDSSADLTAKMGLFLLFTLMSQMLFMAVLFLVFRRRQQFFRYRMLNIASVLGNVGFFGLPLVTALFPDAPVTASYSCIFCVSMNILAWTMGVFCLTGDRKYISPRAAFLNPTVLSVALGFVLYLLNAKSWLPSMLTGGVRTVAGMTTPLSMFILGIRLATLDLKSLFSVPFHYGIAAGKLILFPLFSFLLVQLVPADPVFKASVLILSAAPCASIILNLAEMHGSGQQMAARCALLSTLLSVITLPLLSFLL